MSDIKTLMGDAISQDAADKLQNILDESLSKKEQEITSLINENHGNLDTIESLKREIQELKESHSEDIEYLKGKAEEYAGQVRQDTIDEMTEKAEAYGEFLMGKADEYGDFLQEKAEAYGEHLIEQADAYGDFLQEKAEAYGEHLIEQADAYGDFLQEKAEAYGEHLIEQADAYGESIEEKALKESTKQIEEFKENHLQEFARLDEHNRMSKVFGNLKTLIESSGFTIDEAAHQDSLEEELRESKRRNRELARELREAAIETKRLKVESLVESSDKDVTFKDKEKIVAAALRTKCDNDKELSEIVNTLVENTVLNKTNSNDNHLTNALNESANNENKPKSRWAGRII